MTWDPEQYLKFADARSRPTLDLLARLTGESARTIVDLGCGAGNITRLLAERWPAAQVIGVDSDPAMLARAEATASRISWQQLEIADWHAAGALDLIFSNAALHWLDDQQHLLPRLIGQLAPGGVLAVQMPANFAAASHRILREVAAESRWRDALGPARMGSVLSPVAYHQLLQPHCRQLELWETTYWQLLTGDDAVCEWMRGTTLLPYLARLDATAGERFLDDYRQRLRAAYPQQADGSTLFPFTRIFFIARR